MVCGVPPIYSFSMSVMVAVVVLFPLVVLVAAAVVVLVVVVVGENLDRNLSFDCELTDMVIDLWKYFAVNCKNDIHKYDKSMFYTSSIIISNESNQFQIIISLVCFQNSPCASIIFISSALLTFPCNHDNRFFTTNSVNAHTHTQYSFLYTHASILYNKIWPTAFELDIWDCANKKSDRFAIAQLNHSYFIH